MKTTLLVLLLAPMAAWASEESDAVAVVQKMFDGMAAHDAGMIRGALLPEARFYSVRDEGAAASSAGEEFSTRIAAMKAGMLERFTAKPTVLIRGRMAQVWGEYEFVRDGKFDHCGVDSVSLFKTAEGWKIASIAYTSETTGCKGH